MKNKYEWVKKLNPPMRERLIRFFQSVIDWFILSEAERDLKSKESFFPIKTARKKKTK